MFPQFILTKEEYLQKEQLEREQQEAERKKRYEREQQEASQREQLEFRRYIENIRPDLIHRVDKIKTLIVNPLYSSDTSVNIGVLPGGNVAQTQTTWSTSSSKVHSPEGAAHVVASRRSSVAPDPSAPGRLSLDTSFRRPSTVVFPQQQKLICHYSFQLASQGQLSTHLHTLGTEGYIESLDELGEKWRHLLDVHQFEAYYLTQHDALQRFLNDFGHKIQRLFLKIHPHQEEFLSFRGTDSQLLMEHLNILHLEIPRSMRSLLCEQMQYLLYSVLEVFLHVQKEKFATSPSFKTVDSDLFECFMQNCNTQLRQCTLEGINLNKMWIVNMLESFKSLQSLNIRLCRRVIAREENEVVKHASPAKGDISNPSEEPANAPPSTTDATQRKPHTAQIHNLKAPPPEAQNNPIEESIEVEPLISLHNPHTSLTKVSFSQTDAVNDETILTIATNCPSITDLFISETYVTQRSLLFISQHLRKLRNLSFFGPKLSHVEFCPLGELTRLELNGHHCTVDSLIVLSLCFPKLQRVNFGTKKNIFEGESITQFVNITRGEDAQQKERFLTYAQELLPGIFDHNLHPSKDVNLSALRQNVEEIIEAMKQPGSEDNPSIAFAMVLGGDKSPPGSSPASPGTPTSHPIFGAALSTSTSAPAPSATFTALRRGTLALPTVKRRIGVELFLDSAYEFLLQYAVRDDLAKKEVKAPGAKKKKVVKKKGKKKGTKKGTKKKKKK